MNKHQLYVLGFAFTEDDYVALIRKNKPAWQAGRLNGIGGKVEDSEDSTRAMAREFKEETGVSIPPSQWRFRGRMYGVDWSVFVYTVTSPEVEKVRTVEEEEILLLPLTRIHHSGTILDREGSQLIENVRALIELCNMRPAPGEEFIPLFELNYKRPPL